MVVHGSRAGPLETKRLRLLRLLRNVSWLLGYSATQLLGYSVAAVALSVATPWLLRGHSVATLRRLRGYSYSYRLRGYSATQLRGYSVATPGLATQLLRGCPPWLLRRSYSVATPWLLRGRSVTTPRLLRGYSVATPWLLRAYSVAAVAATAVATPWLLRCCGYLLTYSVATPWRLSAYSVATRLTQWLLGYSATLCGYSPWLLRVSPRSRREMSPKRRARGMGTIF